MDIAAFQLLPHIKGEDDEDTALLCAMADEASRYIRSQSWCPPVTSQYLASGVGGIVAVFLFEFSESIQNTDSRLWVVAGDLPSAYLVVETGDSPEDALHRYCDMMEEWCEAILTSQSTNDVFPVAAKPTLENATSLLARLKFLRSEVAGKKPQES